MTPARLLALAVLAAAVTACGSATVTSTPDTAAQESAISAPSAAATVGSTPEASMPAAPKAAQIGDVITLKDNSDTLQIAVKPARIIKAGAPANDMVKPEAGKRLYGVEVVMKNTGSKVLSDSPGGGAKVVDDEGQEYEQSLFGEISGAHKLGEITLAPGKVRKGVIVFEVPEDAKIVEFMMALSSGYADQKGSWTLKIGRAHV